MSANTSRNATQAKLSSQKIKHNTELDFSKAHTAHIAI